MDRFTDAVHRALQSQNWYAALFITFSLPDICSRLESDNDRTNGEKYAKWFDKYMLWYSGDYAAMSGDDCYVLRCSMLHEGVSDVSHQKRKGVLDRFYFGVLPLHLIQIDNVMHLNVHEFCGHMAHGVSRWLEDFKLGHPDKLHKLDSLLVVHQDTYIADGVRFLAEPFFPVNNESQDLQTRREDMTLRAKPLFRVHQHNDADHTPWIEIGYLTSDDGMPMDLFGLDLPAGTDFQRALQIAEFLNQTIQSFTFTKTTQ